MPVWVVAAAKSATEVLLGSPFQCKQIILIPNDEETRIISVSSAALMAEGSQAIAISYCDSGLPLDVTQGMEIWTSVELKKQTLNIQESNKEESLHSWLKLVAGSGVGTLNTTGEPCLSSFAYELLDLNLRSLIPKGYFLHLEVVFPAGKDLAQRTSNRSFGVVDGLSIIGTQAEVQVSASPDQLKNTINELRQRCLASEFAGNLIFVIGENGFDLALKLGFSQSSILKVGNWLGPLMVAAAESDVKQLLLFGYHGKLIKLAGGIFHTHNHLADARLEVLTFLAVKEGLPLVAIQSIGRVSSIEEALLMLDSQYPQYVQRLWLRIANEIEKSSHTYISRYIPSSMQIGTALFDRKRNMRWCGTQGLQLLDNLGVTSPS